MTNKSGQLDYTRVNRNNVCEILGLTSPEFQKLEKAGCPKTTTNGKNYFNINEVFMWFGNYKAAQQKSGKVDNDFINLAEAKRLETIGRAKKLDIENAESEGKLISANKVEQDAFVCARNYRDAVLNIPSRVSPLLASETNDRKIEIVLTEEIKKVLQRLHLELKDAV